MKITKSQLKQIIKEELNELRRNVAGNLGAVAGRAGQEADSRRSFFVWARANCRR